MDGYNMTECSKITLLHFIKYVNYTHGVAEVDLVQH